MKIPLWRSRVILLFIFVTGTYQTIIPENATRVSTIQKNNKFYTVDDAAEFCNAFYSGNGNSNERSENMDPEYYSVDLNKLLVEINDAKKNETLPPDDMCETEVSKSQWRTGTLESQNQYFLKSGQYSDITFEVGPDNNTEMIHAHKLLLARGSPIFEAIINATSTGGKVIHYRFRDIDVNAFKTLIQFTYTGKLCFQSFDEACEMLSIAAKFQMPELAEYCHYHIWLHMYPRNLWSAFQCAIKANDSIMTSAAMDMIQQKTENAVIDPAFTSIPKSTLIAFLSGDSLNVSSELILYQAALRWAMAEATRRGLPQDPESLRECLGDALQYFRFLTLTPTEFANMQYTSKILTYSESLAVIFNLNSPNVMFLPSNLSSNKKPRKFAKTNSFNVIKRPSYTPTCKGSDLDLIKTETIFDVLTTTVFRANELNNPTIASVKIPRCEHIIDCEQTEDLTIAILDSENNLIHSTHYINNNMCQLDDSKFYNIKLDEEVSIPESDSFYKIKVILNKPGIYPFSLGEGSREQVRKGVRRYDYRREEHVYDYELLLGENEFVYTLRTFFE